MCKNKDLITSSKVTLGGGAEHVPHTILEWYTGTPRAIVGSVPLTLGIVAPRL